MALQRYEDFMDRLKRIQKFKQIRLKDRSNPIEDLCEAEFVKRYRLSKEIAIQTFNKIKNRLTISDTRRGTYLPPQLKFLVVLRFFASGSFQLVIGDLLNITQPSVCGYIKTVSRALASLRPELIKFPTPEQAVRIRNDFYAIAGFPGIVGAIDCTHVQILSPGGENAELFRCRKGCFTINVQAICDADLKFLDVVARWYGSAHDSRIFDNSDIKTKIEDRSAPGNLIGDSGYTLLYYLMTPFLEPKTGPQKRYNDAQVKTRNPIERAFGVLKRRFACLKMLRLKVVNVLPVIVATCVLHNIARSMGDRMYEVSEEGDSDDDLDDHYVCRRTTDLGEAVRNSIVNDYFT